LSSLSHSKLENQKIEVIGKAINGENLFKYYKSDEYQNETYKDFLYP